MGPYTLLHNLRTLTPDGRFVPASILLARGIIVDVIARGADDVARRDDVTVVDLAGGYAIPGFVDAHTHLRALALKRLRSDLSPARSLGDLLERLGRHAAAASGAVVGVDFDESAWDVPALPTRGELDDIDATRPVLARRVCGHVGVANTALLERLTDVPASFVDRESGRITEDALWAANQAVAPPDDDVAASFAPAVAHLHSLGITAIHDIVTPGTMASYLRGLDGVRAPLGIDALVVGSVDDLETVRTQCAGVAPDWFRAVGVKHFADGSLGARTAALREPYADDDTRGELLLDEGALAAAFRRAAAAGAVCAVHAIGDRAIAAVLDARRGLPGEGWQLRVEHAEVLDDALVGGLAATGTCAVVQPNFIRNWGGEDGLYARRLGRARWATTDPLRSLLGAGVAVAFGSDGMPYGPLFGIGGATRHPVPGQSIGPAAALELYTAAPLRISGHARPAGAIAPDRAADITVLAGNPHLADPDALAVRATVVAGRVAFPAP